MVSVIVPVYNVEKYLGECVDSVLTQTYTELEIILVDDGSPDRCGEICDEYALKDSRVKVIHKENGGLSDARNAGMKAARGKYIYFLDSDDYIAADAIEKLVGISEKEQTDIVYFDYVNIMEDFNDPDYSEDCGRKHSYAPDSGSKMLERMFRNQEYHSMVQLQFYRLNFIIDNNLAFYKGIIHEDELFTVQACLKAKKTACLNEQLYFRRLRAGSIMSGRMTVRSFDGCYVCVRKLAEELKKHSKNSPERNVIVYELTSQINVLLDKYVFFGREELEKIYGKFKRICRLSRENNYFGDKKLKIKLKNHRLYRAYRRLRKKY